MAFQPQPKLFSLMGWNATGDLGGLTFYTNKRGKLTYFLKAPPTTPPTFWQLRNQNNFRLAAQLWEGLDPKVRDLWELATKRLSLRITGYNLWIHFITTWDVHAIDTIFRQAKIPTNP